MAIHQWPQHQRPPEKLLEKGAKALSYQELLAIFPLTGVAGMNAIDLAYKLLIYFGSRGSLLCGPKQFLFDYGIRYCKVLSA